jgi:diaminopimelate decarboxylase
MKKDNFSRTILKEKLKDTGSEAAYILRSEVFEDEYDLLLDCFKKYYDSVNIAYSFKTNYIPNFLNIVKNKKGYAEVVSIMELELALRVGFLPQNIFFNGPFKHQKETSNYLRLGVLVNVDSYDEFRWIEEFANKSEINCRIGLRLNFNLNDSPSRFGLDIHDATIHKIITRSNSSKFLSLESLHYHYASRELSAWKNCMDNFLSFLSKLDIKFFNDLKYISLGGGMFSRMNQYLEDQIAFDIPSFNDYAENSIKYLSSFLETHRCATTTKPEVLIEPGTALASKAIDFVVEVVSIKKVSDITYINTTGSKYNMNPSPNRINSPIKVLSFSAESAVEVQNAKLCGYTCIESDIIHNDFNGKIAKGDLIIFQEVGSYSVVMKPPFILPDVAIIEFDEKSETFETVRNRQTFENIFSNFEFFNR